MPASERAEKRRRADALRPARGPGGDPRGVAPHAAHRRLVHHRASHPDADAACAGWRCAASCIPEERGRRILGVSTDVTEHRLAEQALLAEQERAQVTLASIGDGVVRTDAEGRVDYLNPVAESSPATPPRRRAAGPHRDLPGGRRGAPASRAPTRSSAACARGRWSCSPATAACCAATARHSRCATRRRRSATPAAASRACVLVVQDVTQLRGLEREMIYLARHDALTGLINRRELERQLEARHRQRRATAGGATRLLHGPRRVQAGQRHLRPRRRRRAAAPAHRAARARRCATPTCSPASAATSSACCCATARSRAPRRWPRSSAAPCAASASPGRTASSTSASASAWCRSPAESGQPLAGALGRRRRLLRGQGAGPQPRPPLPARRPRGGASATARCSGCSASTAASRTAASASTAQPIRPLQGDGQEMAEILLRLVGEDGQLHAHARASSPPPSATT